MAGPLRSRRDVELPDPGAATPPHSVEAEQAVLGGLLIDALAWDQVGDLIVADDFYRPDHRPRTGLLGRLRDSLGGPRFTAAQVKARAREIERVMRRHSA